MYLNQVANPQSDQPVSERGIFDQSPMLDFEQNPIDTPQNVGQMVQNHASIKNSRLEPIREEVKILDKPQRKVIEIRVFYDDQTWDTFVPMKK